VTVDDSVFLLMNIVECIVIIVLTFFLPETKGIHLADKINEQEKIEKEYEGFEDVISQNDTN